MSTPAPSRYKAPTNGWAAIPNSVIENQSAFTHAELALTLIVLRRGGTREPVTVSDRNWEEWTGLKPRMKEHAIAGLKQKCLRVEGGRGDLAKFRFEASNWHTFVRTAERVKPHTAGRKLGVKAAPGAKVHPECRGRGCAMLAGENSSNGLTLVPATPIAQPVAQTNSKTVTSSAPSLKDQKPISIAPATPIAQPVAQTAEIIWHTTLAMLRRIFPAVGLAFLVRLLAVVAALFQNVTDAELAQAIELAYVSKKRRQHSEGLFLYTVPEALAELRRRPKPRPQASTFETTADYLRQSQQRLVARGAPFDAFAPEISEAIEQVERFKNPEAAGDLLEGIAGRMFTVAWAKLSPVAQHDLVSVTRKVFPGDGKQAEKWRRQQSFHELNLPLLEI